MTVFSSARRKTGLSVPKVGASSGAAATSSGADHFQMATTDVYTTRNIVADLPDRVGVSAATYAAAAPCLDATISSAVLNGPRPHILAAVTSSDSKAHGSEFLRRNMARELEAQMGACRGDVLAAFKATLAQMDLKFRALHIYNSHVLDGTHIAVAYLDLTTSMLHLASNGGCRAVVTTRDALGRSQVTLELGRPAPEETAAAQDAAEAAAAARLRGARQRQQQTPPPQRQPTAKPGAGLHGSGGRLDDSHMTSMQLSGDVESIVLGSPGLWHELPVEQAAVRVATGASISPCAMGGNSAALLAQAALQNVATRVSKYDDPRMAVLRDTATLQQLWTGSKRNFKWGGRQPLRRRRADVHGDLSAVVIRLDWAGTECLPRHAFACKRQACAGAAVPRSASGASIASAASIGSLRAAGRASHWDAVRAHFLHFRPAAAEAARARWYAAVDAALASAAQLRAEAAAQATTAAPAASEAPITDMSQAAAAAALETQQPQQAAPQASPTAAPAHALPTGKATAGEGSIAIQAIASPLTAPTAAEADDRAAMRRALGTTSYRRLGVNGALAVPLPKDASLSSMRGLTLQQLSVH